MANEPVSHNEKILLEKARLTASAALHTGPEAADELVHLLHDFSVRWRANIIAAQSYKGESS